MKTSKEENSIETIKIEGNKLIAEFMGLEGRLNHHGEFVTSYLDGDEHCHEESVLYHSCWDWLMPVVAKCIITDIPGRPWSKSERFYSYLSVNDFVNIDYVYEAVVQFIKWYNKNKI